MEEDYKATVRNGHALKDMYNPETNTLDIRSNGLYPSNVLSNMCTTSSVSTELCVAVWRDSYNH